MRRTDQRRGFLVSAIVHLMLLMALSRHAANGSSDADATAPPAEVRERVFLPPAEVLRQLIPRPPARPVPPRPAPVPTPPPAQAGKDRISVGAPVNARQTGPLVLRREDDLTKVAKGRPDAVPDATPTPPPTPPPARAAQVDGGAGPGPGATGGLRLPPGLGDLATGREGAGRGATGLGGPQGTGPRSISSALQQELERRSAQAGALGLPSGTVQQMGPLLFDPQGADFTLWLNQFKNEVYRNWIVPQTALLGFHGSVDIEFVVERDGHMSSLRLLRSSGTVSLDRAAENALRGSRWLPLPADYRPARVPMTVTFIYNEPPRES